MLSQIDLVAGRCAVHGDRGNSISNLQIMQVSANVEYVYVGGHGIYPSDGQQLFHHIQFTNFQILHSYISAQRQKQQDCFAGLFGFLHR